ncbi:MAG: undecaprenyl/decaprenyl-phosphate alpha-N-acetylglucosaminyl 1-phosphate transferase [Planctomycetaceae bacterium]|nr:undecaprenyl/decaprenyl-phosphate alpha-N-acetylglucosaminyl 1-phosphate transferase [Planctomycetaceae bacterium]
MPPTLPPLILPLVASLVGLGISIALTPFVRHYALRFGLVDYPDRRRKLHLQPVARCGGIVLLATLLLSVSLAFLIFPGQSIHLVQKSSQAISLGIGAIAITILGLIDDKYGMLGKQKLAFQILICLGIISFGFSIDTIQIFGYPIDLGLIAWPVTLMWLLLCINSINLIDGADGVCPTVGWIAFAAVAIISSYTGNHMEAIIAASLAGALVGFLVYNLPPASVFLGDNGSMLIGLFLGVLTMRSWFSKDSSMSITIPLVLMAIPIFDSSMAVVRRKLTGRSLFSVDRGHLHHHLIRRGFQDRALVGIITLFSFLTASGAVAGVLLGSDWISLATMAFSIGALVVFKLFGFAELKLMYHRIEGFCTSLFIRPDCIDSFVHQESVHLQGTRNWDVIWQTLVEFAEKHGLSRIEMDLNMPWLHEGYHAEWQKAELPEGPRRWSLKFPLILGGESFGGLEFIGKQQEGESLLVLAQLTELLDAIHSQLEAFRCDHEENSSSESPRDEVTTRGSKVAVAAEKSGFLPSSTGVVTSGVTAAVEIP